MALTAKMLGGLCLVALLVFNVTSMVGSNADDSGLSLSELMTLAKAVDGEEGPIDEHSCVIAEGDNPTFPFFKRRCATCTTNFTNESNRSTCWR